MLKATCYNNSNISSWFQPKRGIRQGCPISPYLFLLVIELLAICIREHNEIEGIKIGEEELKLSQLADDIIVYCKNRNSV